MIPLLIVLSGPLHGIHQEMVANAQRQGTVVVVAKGPDSPAEVARRLSGVTVVTQPPETATLYEPTIRERIVSAMLDPEHAFLAFAIGMLLIFAEFCFPGTVLPGAFGGVIVMTALYGLAASNLRPSGILLLTAATCLFAASAFLRPHAWFGFAAAVAMCAGAILLVDSTPQFRIRPGTAIAVTIPFALVTLFLTGIAQRARANKLPEQNTQVVFSSPKDILSTISGESGEEVSNAAPARRT
jgi:membrane-bound ClpP family serine protease